MIRKDFIILAISIRMLKESGVTSGPILKKICNKLTEILADNLEVNYSNFNRDKFIKYINQ